MKRICFLGSADCYTAGAAYSVVSGRHRCKDADLVVLQRLDDLLTPVSSEWLVHATYVFALGIRVVPLSTWQVSRGILCQIPPEDLKN